MQLFFFEEWIAIPDLHELSANSAWYAGLKFCDCMKIMFMKICDGGQMLLEQIVRSWISGEVIIVIPCLTLYWMKSIFFQMS